MSNSKKHPFFEYKPSSWDIAFAKKDNTFNFGIPLGSAAVGALGGWALKRGLKIKNSWPVISGFLAGLGLGDVTTDMLAERHSAHVTPSEIKKVRMRLGHSKLFKHLAGYEQASAVAEGLLPFGWMITETMDTPFTKKLSKYLAAGEAALMLTRVGVRAGIMNPMVRKAMRDSNYKPKTPKFPKAPALPKVNVKLNKNIRGSTYGTRKSNFRKHWPT